MVTNLDQVPTELRERRQWVTWSYAERDGKRTKQPHDPHTDRLARVNDPQTWGTFEEAASSCGEHGRDGVGFVLAADRAFTGIDLDHVLDQDGGIIYPQVGELVAAARTYAEVSPSGTGLHLLFAGPIPEDVRRDCKSRAGQDGGAWGIELYDHDRFLTVTGRAFEVRSDG
ncbi:MAG: hypothetical protein SOI24_08245 [Coriobacteriales bacterium]|jgi:primase-polymerase (primpol)-like protein